MYFTIVFEKFKEKDAEGRISRGGYINCNIPTLPMRYISQTSIPFRGGMLAWVLRKCSEVSVYRR